MEERLSRRLGKDLHIAKLKAKYGNKIKCLTYKGRITDRNKYLCKYHGIFGQLLTGCKGLNAAVNNVATNLAQPPKKKQETVL